MVAEPASPATLPQTRPIEVTEETPARDTPAASTSAFVTTLELDDLPRATATLGDFLALSPGLQVNRLGGPGSFSTLLVRGASGGHLAVFLDGVPVSSSSDGAVNLEELPLEAIEAIEVYRGSSPVAFGADAIAGVMNLVTRTPTRPLEARIRLSAGSFGDRRAMAGVGLKRGAWDGLATVGFRTYAGDFPDYFDNATLYNAADDAIRLRQNSDATILEGTARARYRGAGGPEVTLQASGVSLEQGLPGRASGPPTTAARYATQWVGVHARAAGSIGRTRLSALADARYREQRLSDPLAEVGLTPVATHDRTGAKGLTGRATVLLNPRQLLELVAVVRDETWRPEEEGVERARTRLGLGAQYELRPGRLAMVPGLLYDHLVPRATGALPTTDLDPQEGLEPLDLISPRLGLELTPLASVAWRIRANGGAFHHPPSFSELYGQGLIDPNPALRPERGYNLDLGTSIDAPFDTGLAPGALHLEAAGFFNQVHDLIAYLQNSFGSVRPENVDDARMMGLELSADLRWEGVGALSGGYTWLSATNLANGRQLPGRPRHAGHALLRLGAGWLTGYYRIDASSSAYLDAFNALPIPPRVIQDAGLTARLTRTPLRGLEATLEVKNLLNVFYQDVSYSEAPQMVADYIGFPLPGRALYLTLGWRR
jgi:iron complex outermembrane receptor protein